MHAFAPTNKLTSKKKKKNHKLWERKSKSRNEPCWKVLYLQIHIYGLFGNIILVTWFKCCKITCGRKKYYRNMCCVI